MNTYFDTFPTPCGNFSVAVNATDSILATAFGGVEELRTRFSGGELVRDAGRLDKVRRQIAEYFDGQREHFELSLAPSGTPFQQEVWTALQRIPSGETRSYGELATKLGHPGGARAVGRANATNPIALLIPCHRVIGGNGSLTGYAFGEEIKRRLLIHEGALVAA